MWFRWTAPAALLLALAPAALGAQQAGSADASRRAVLEARRDSLENQIMARFIQQLREELHLDRRQVTQAERVMRDGAGRRRDLMRASSDLRSRMHRAVRDRTTTDATFAGLLAEHEALRQRENDVWRAEQDELGRIFSPRQQTQFLMLWARFQDEVRDIIVRQLRPPPTRQ
jgi:chromosome segregation ATPase